MESPLYSKAIPFLLLKNEKADSAYTGHSKLTCSSTTAWTAASGTMGLLIIVWLADPSGRTLFRINCSEPKNAMEYSIHRPERLHNKKKIGKKKTPHKKVAD
jgi:hypothetical protein